VTPTDSDARSAFEAIHVSQFALIVEAIVEEPTDPRMSAVLANPIHLAVKPAFLRSDHCRLPVARGEPLLQQLAGDGMLVKCGALLQVSPEYRRHHARVHELVLIIKHLAAAEKKGKGLVENPEFRRFITH
jgi:hypothetical protein